MPGERQGRFELSVPLDASAIDNPDRPVKVAVFGSRGAEQEQVVKFSGERLAYATFVFDDQPGRLRVVVGPENATLEELRHLQTVSVDVSARRLQGRELRLEPIIISPFYWWWWVWWCREFTITGRVLCADGSAVPGATVCAYDVDAWWWFISEEQVGCATTDATG